MPPRRRRSESALTLGIAGHGAMSDKNLKANLNEYFDSIDPGIPVDFVFLYADTATQRKVRDLVAGFVADMKVVMREEDDLTAEKIAEFAKPVVMKKPADKFARMLIEAANTGEARLLAFWDDDDEDLDRATTLLNESGVPLLSVAEGMQAITLEVQEEDEETTEEPVAEAPEESEEEGPDPLAEITWTREFFADYDTEGLRTVRGLLGLSTRGRFNHDKAVGEILDAAFEAGYEVAIETEEPVDVGEPVAEPEPEPEPVKAVKPKAPAKPKVEKLKNVAVGASANGQDDTILLATGLPTQVALDLLDQIISGLPPEAVVALLEKRLESAPS